jgi:hypothetical protein
MTTPDTSVSTASRAAARARFAYERTHVLAGVRGVVVAAALCALAYALHDITPTSQLVAGALAITLGVLGWRGGAWQRGSLVGVLAGVPALVAPCVAFALAHGGHFAHCPSCDGAPTATCIITCFSTSALVGMLVGFRASQDRAPHRFAAAALVAAVFTGTLACASTGLGGALGVVFGLVAGGATGWVFAHRTA